jgi:hypothetical protein
MRNTIKNELFNIISGKSKVSDGAIIQTITCYLGNRKNTSSNIEIEKYFKEQEKERLIEFINLNNLWIENIDFSQYISEGAEQRVFLKSGESVLKLNDGIYYSCWYDYFINLLLHNYFFPDTAYSLLGFTIENNILYAVVDQQYVTVTSETNLRSVKEFLLSNGFVNNRNNDYINSELGIIIEDLHDENVLTKNEILYFIDTVFYLTSSFWEN